MKRRIVLISMLLMIPYVFAQSYSTSTIDEMKEFVLNNREYKNILMALFPELNFSTENVRVYSRTEEIKTLLNSMIDSTNLDDLALLNNGQRNTLIELMNWNLSPAMFNRFSQMRWQSGGLKEEIVNVFTVQIAKSTQKKTVTKDAMQFHIFEVHIYEDRPPSLSEELWQMMRDENPYKDSVFKSRLLVPIGNIVVDDDMTSTVLAFYGTPNRQLEFTYFLGMQNVQSFYRGFFQTSFARSLDTGFQTYYSNYIDVVRQFHTKISSALLPE